jgi:transposase-like protein
MEAGQAEAKRFRNKLEIEQLVAEFEKSGLSRKAFSGEHGISVHTLDAYRRRLHKRRKAGDDSHRLLPVEIREPVRASGGELTVALSNGRRIEVNRGFDGDTLKRLVGLLEQA